jgi:hypothetical protein
VVHLYLSTDQGTFNLAPADSGTEMCGNAILHGAQFSANSQWPVFESLLVLMTRCLLLFDGCCRVFTGRPL